MPTFNNPQIAAFYTQGGPYSARNSNVGQLRRRNLGSITAASTSTGPGTSTTVPNAGNNLQTTAVSVASLANSATNLAKGVLQAEAAQNAINAQRNLTNALTPGVITILIGVLVYVVAFKK